MAKRSNIKAGEKVTMKVQYENGHIGYVSSKAAEIMESKGEIKVIDVVGDKPAKKEKESAE